MNKEKYFREMFESLPDYRKIVLLLFLIKDDKILLKVVCFTKSDIQQLSLEF